MTRGCKKPQVQINNQTHKGDRGFRLNLLIWKYKCRELQRNNQLIKSIKETVKIRKNVLEYEMRWLWQTENATETCPSSWETQSKAEESCFIVYPKHSRNVISQHRCSTGPVLSTWSAGPCRQFKLMHQQDDEVKDFRQKIHHVKKSMHMTIMDNFNRTPLQGNLPRNLSIKHSVEKNELLQFQQRLQ